MFKKTLTFATAFLLAAAVLATPAEAQKRTVIKGNVKQSTAVEKATTIATGKNNVAKTRIGSIGGGSNIKGNVKQNTYVKSATTIATGSDNTAITNVGTIRNAEIDGNVEQSTVVGSVTTIASGSGNTAVTQIGGIGDE